MQNNYELNGLNMNNGEGEFNIGENYDKLKAIISENNDVYSVKT